jgi:transcriptional regulator with XRE-family HTH domain
MSRKTVKHDPVEFHGRVEHAALMKGGKTIGDRIRERRLAIGMSQAELGRIVGVSRAAPGQWESGASVPTGPNLVAIAAALQTTPEYLAMGENYKLHHNFTIVPRQHIPVKGLVQAGVWLEVTSMSADELGTVEYVPIDPEYPDAPRFVLRTVGPSMNRIVPEGASVVCITFIDMGRDPVDGEIVVVIRRTKTGLTETSLKQYVRKPDGKVELWPRSFHPDFQKPLELTHNGEEEDALLQAGVRDVIVNVRPTSER